MRRITVLDTPSNLGLRPPAPGTVPGCYKLPWALREQRLVERLGARDAGALVPPRYDRGDWKPGDGVFNAAGLASYTTRLADRVGSELAGVGPAGSAGPELLVLLGGDCSILLGAMLGLRRRGRYGLAYLDGHSDFRHVGNSPHVGAAAGEGTAQLTGRGQADVVDLEGLRPYVRESDLELLGLRDEDEALAELRGVGIRSATVGDLRAGGADTVAAGALARLESPELDGFWVHLDVDVLDPAVMPAVDSPDPGGLAADELLALLTPLLASPRCVGLDVAIFDPDLDPDGRLAGLLTDLLVTALGGPATAA